MFLHFDDLDAETYEEALALLINKPRFMDLPVKTTVGAIAIVSASAFDRGVKVGESNAKGTVEKAQKAKEEPHYVEDPLV